MRTSQINGGDFKKYTPIGEDGSPVWMNAEAFRSAIAREPKLGKAYADFLAEPKFNAAGDHVDWYIPFEPKHGGEYEIVSWQSASPEEKRAALVRLRDFHDHMVNFGYDLEARAITGDNKLFAHFLTGTDGTCELPAIHFPDESCIFIVDGQPVITFWGFTKAGGRPTGSPFKEIDPPVRPAVRGTAGAATAGAVPPAPVQKHHGLCRFWWLWLPLLLLLLLLLLYLLWWYFYGRGLPLFSVKPDLANLSLNPQVAELSADERAEAEEILRGQGYIIGEDGIVVPIDDADPEALKAVTVDTAGLGTVTVPDSTAAVPADPAAVTDDAAAVPADPAAVTDDAAAVPADPAAQTDAAAQDAAVPPELNAADAAADPNAATDPNAADPNAANNSQDPNAQDNGAKDDSQPDAAAAQDPAQGADNANNGADPNASAADPNKGALAPVDLGASGGKGQSLANALDNSQNAVDKGDVRVLDGDWTTRNRLSDSESGKDLSVAYNFDNGSGKVTVTRSDGVKCTGDTSSTISGGNLTIGNATAKCADGKTYDIPQVSCSKNSDGKTVCSGINKNGVRVNMQLAR